MKIWKQYRKIIRIVWKNGKGLLCLYTGLMVFSTLLPTIAAYSQKWFLTALERTYPLIIVCVFLAVYTGIKFLNSLYQYVDSFFAHKFIFKVNFIFNSFLTEKLYKEPQENFYAPDFNDKLKKVSKGQEKIPFQIFGINGIFIKIFVIGCIQIPLIIADSPLLLMMVFLDSFVSLLVIGKIARHEYELEQKLIREQRKSDYFGEILSSKAHAKEIRVFGAQTFFYQHWFEGFRQLSRTRERFNISKQRRKMIAAVWSFFINSAVLVMLFYLLLQGSIDLAGFIFLYTIVPATSEQCKDLVSSITGDVYGNFLDIEHYIKYVEETSSSDIRIDTASAKCIDFQKFEVRNISYMYPNGSRLAVKDISLTINKGEILCILGYNGSGKTTLSKLLTGILAPTSGDIFINDRNVREYGTEERFQLFGIAYQDFTRYMLSVRDNIGYGYIEKYDEETITEAFQAANCETLHAKLPQGLETKLGKLFYTDGVELSGGEWQRLALARAYMGNHEILLLDEPTASIDPIKEMEMLQYFRQILKDRTAILISHRVGFARLADRIIVLKDGVLVENGSHEELLNRKGFYSQIFYSQKDFYK